MLMTSRSLALRLVSVGASGLVLAACSSGASASGDSTASPSLSSSAPATATTAGPPPAGIPTAVACDEINRLTRAELDGLTDDSPAHWESFAFALQNIANGADDPNFRTALTDVATGALTASESLAAGEKAGAATVAFRDAVPALDTLCKKAGAPLI